jgi:hypothetical protein
MLFRYALRLLVALAGRSLGRSPRQGLAHSLLLAACATMVGVAQAQAPILLPFPATLTEGHECLPAPAATSACLGFRPAALDCTAIPQANITGLPIGGVLIRGVTGAVLPPNSGSNYLYGRGTDIDITFGDKKGFFRKFGGFFSRTNIATGVTTVELTFLFNGVVQGLPQLLKLPPTAGPGTSAYIFIGFDLTLTLPSNGFNEVQIRGKDTNGNTIPGFAGFVGTDDLEVAF